MAEVRCDAARGTVRVHFKTQQLEGSRNSTLRCRCVRTNLPSLSPSTLISPEPVRASTPPLTFERVTLPEPVCAVTSPGALCSNGYFRYRLRVESAGNVLSIDFTAAVSA